MYRDRVEIINLVVEYIESHLDDKLDLNLIANAVGYSKFYLHRIFADTTGMTIHDYVKRRKLTESAKLLALSHMSVIDIAFHCGYESQQAFSVAFKTMYKLSPSQFRFNGNYYPLQLPWKLGNQMEENMLEHTNLRLANMDDLDPWIELMRMVIDGYPHMDECEYYLSIRKSISEQHAIVIYDGSILIGALSFDGVTGTIEFLGVHPLYRKFGIHVKLLNSLIHEYLLGTEISMTTFRDGDKADTGYRKLLKDFGFVERELLLEYGYPTQRMSYEPIAFDEDLL